MSGNFQPLRLSVSELNPANKEIAMALQDLLNSKQGRLCHFLRRWLEIIYTARCSVVITRYSNENESEIIFQMFPSEICPYSRRFLWKKADANSVTGSHWDWQDFLHLCFRSFLDEGNCYEMRPKFTRHWRSEGLIICQPRAKGTVPPHISSCWNISSFWASFTHSWL